MKTWAEDRIADFQAMQREWPVSVSRNGITKTGIKTPDVVDKMMRETSYLTDVRSTFDLLVTDWETLKLGSRVQFTCNEVSYEVLQYREDAADPIIQFVGVRLK